MSKTLPCRSRRRSHTITAIAFLVLPVLVFARAVADTLPFTVDGNPAGRDVAVSAKSSTEVVLNLLRTTTKGAPDTVDLTLSQFTDESGRPFDGGLIVGKGPTAAKAVEHRGLKLSGPLIPIRLTIPELPTQGKYRRPRRLQR